MKMKDAIRAQNRAAFLQWVERTAPDLYQESVARALAIKDQRARTLKGFGLGALTDTSATSGWDIFGNILTSLPDLANQYLDVQERRDLMQINADRARQGLAPVNEQGQVLNTLAPSQFNANVGVASVLSNPMLWLVGGGAVLALLLLARRGRR